MPGEALRGRRVLIVEDNYLMAMGLAAVLKQAGAFVAGPVANIREALALLDPLPDCASLDVQLGKETSFPIADELAARGVPFLFCTGTTVDIPARHRIRPVCSKPFRPRNLLDGLASLLA
ncbi:response regulator [Sphingomonas sp. PsM26]|jgi:CheY-like chemotaxis protein|nr:response regulator [Sphingomonas sp. PsM26]